MVVAQPSAVFRKSDDFQVGAAMQKNGNDRLATIMGVIIPADWDRHGNVTGVSISGFDEQEYRVQKRIKGAELIQHIRKNAEVVGWIEVEQGKKKITVKDYRIRKSGQGAGA
jgi:hypothetical protein